MIKSSLSLLLFCFCLVCFFTQVEAQKKWDKQIIVDTTLQSFEGNIQYHVQFVADSARVLNGPVQFTSLLQMQEGRNVPAFRELTFKGQMVSGLKHGAWVFNLNHYLLDKFEIQHGQTLRFLHQINGTEYTYKHNYVDGMREGQWRISSRSVLNGRLGKEQSKGNLHFENNQVSGPFFFKGMTDSFEEFSVTGFVNKQGFLDSILTIHYMREGIPVVETRLYEDGFLLDLRIEDEQTDTLIYAIQLLDVKHKLIDLSDESRSTRISKDETFYGLTFDNNYLEDDPRLLSQNEGNKVLRLAIDHLLFGDDLMVENYVKPIGFHTRKFKFTYNPDEQLYIDSIMALNAEIKDRIASLSERPKFVLRKSTSLELTRMQHIFALIRHKTDLIDQEFRLIQSDYFKYTDRTEFYKNGIEGLNKVDSLEFNFSGKTFSEAFDLGILVDQPEKIVYQTLALQKSLLSFIQQADEVITRSLVQFDEQEQIDELESIISKVATNLDESYPNLETYKSKPNGEIPFAYKMYISVNERLLSPVKQRYLQNSLSVDEALQVGNNMLCLMRFLLENKAEFDRIEGLPRFWNDSVFTVYQDNPFDYRPFESKIMSGVQSAVNTLLKYQANNMLNAKSCEALKEELAGIVKLQKRVLYLRQNYQTENVILLDRSLRRERVPQRIMRMLEL